LAEKDTYYTKSSAVLRVAEKLPLENGLEHAASLGLIAPRFLRDGVYGFISANRYKLMGEREMCRFGDDEEFADRFISDEEVIKPLNEENIE
jgi:predicted DCC family thiol-disulfide oxidoreductase YuxK